LATALRQFGEEGEQRGTRAFLVARGNRVFQINTDLIGTGGHGLGVTLRARARHEQQAAARVVDRSAHGAPTWEAKCSAIWRRVAYQVPGFCATYCRNFSNAPMRPGRPMMRRCRPSDITLGLCSPSAYSVSKLSMA